MIYNVVLGSSIAEEIQKLTINSDDKKNMCLCFEGIHQRMKVSAKCRKIRNAKIDDFKITTDTYDGDSIATYSLGSETDKSYKWVNNRKNMNPLLIKKNILNGTENSDEEEYIMYITLGSKIKLLSYSTSYDMLQSFYKRDKCYGCVIVLNSNDILHADDDVVITLKYADYTQSENPTYKIAKICINGNGQAYLNINNVSLEEYSDLNHINEKYKNSLGFKIKLRSNSYLLTSTYLVDKSHKDYIESLVKAQDISNAKIYVISDEMVDGITDSTIPKELENILNEIRDSHIRAITVAGVNLPLRVYKEYNIVYLFNYDTESQRLFCKRTK